MSKLPKIIFSFIKPILKRTMSSPKPYSLYNLGNAEEIKNHVKIPVVVVGGIREMKDIKDIIEQDKSDFVSMSRPFIMEPDIVKKFREGRQTKSKCINCNYCMIGTEVESLKCYYGRI
jgi:2,4-dienoyl-CoA reductase-like NADH-dependent reductase (Old Yellow Enzyme family)